MVELIGGSPWDKEGFGPGTPASFSRFLLPFSYKLQRKYNGKKELQFETVSIQNFDIARIRYFTSETAKVLYKRATWARIPKEAWENNRDRCGPFTFMARKSNRCSQIKIAQPWIVLFEGQKQDAGAHELLQHGFLILEAQLDSSYNCPSLNDLLEFNDLFRFVDNPYPEHVDCFFEALADFPADFCSCKKINDCDPTSYFSLYKNRWLSLLKLPLHKDEKPYSLVTNQSLEFEKRNDHSCHLSCEKNKCLMYADNRAFVWTCAMLEKGANSLQEKYKQKVSEPWKFGHWLRLLNVDPPLDTPDITHAEIKEFEKEWLKERTYQRWAEKGTFYGYCYHSGAMLGPPAEAPPLWYHFGQMYFDQILLLFYLRITLFAFSRDLTQINDDDNPRLLAKEFKKLRRSFAKFTNLYQFPLISNQQQGVEMYEIARKNMDIDNLFRDVRNEVTSTHEYLEMKASAKLGCMANVLAVIGVFIALFALPEVIIIKLCNFLKNSTEWILACLKLLLL